MFSLFSHCTVLFCYNQLFRPHLSGFDYLPSILCLFSPLLLYLSYLWLELGGVPSAVIYALVADQLVKTTSVKYPALLSILRQIVRYLQWLKLPVSLRLCFLLPIISHPHQPIHVPPHHTGSTVPAIEQHHSARRTLLPRRTLISSMHPFTITTGPHCLLNDLITSINIHFHFYAWIVGLWESLSSVSQHNPNLSLLLVLELCTYNSLDGSIMFRICAHNTTAISQFVSVLLKWA